MARFIIHDKLYDTKKMEFIAHVRKWYKFTDGLYIRIFGENMGRNFDCKLYCSSKGNWLLVHENEVFQTIGEAIEEYEAKELLQKYDYDTYCRLYGELEEAQEVK